MTLMADLEVEQLQSSMSPTMLYLSTLTPGGQRTQFMTLSVVVRHMSDGQQSLADFMWHEVPVERLAAMRRWMLDKYAPNTVTRVLAGIRCIIKIAWLQGHIDERSYRYRMTFLKTLVANNVRSGRMLEPAEIMALMSAANGGRQFIALRNRAILAVMFEAGLRRSEICNLQLRHYGKGFLHVIKGKNLRSRVVPINRACTRLDEWIFVRGNDEGPLFCRKRGQKLTPEAVAAAIAIITRRAGIAPWRCHDGRRTYISTLLATGSDAVTAAALAGHTSPVVTMRYDKRPQMAKVEAVSRLNLPI